MELERRPSGDMHSFPEYLDLHVITAKDSSGVQYFQDHGATLHRSLSIANEKFYLEQLYQELRILPERPKLYIPYTGLHRSKFYHLEYLDLTGVRQVRESEITNSDNLVRTSYKLHFTLNSMTIKKSVIGKYVPFRLLDLPREIRQEIMRLSWVAERHHLNILDDLKVGDQGVRKCNGFGHGAAPGKAYGILFANKMLHEEALVAGYGECRLELRAFHHTKVLWICKALRENTKVWEHVRRVSFQLTHMNGKSAAKQLVPHLREMPKLKHVNIRMDPWSHWTSRTTNPILSRCPQLSISFYASSLTELINAALCFLPLKDKVELSFSFVWKKQNGICKEFSYSQVLADSNTERMKLQKSMFCQWKNILTSHGYDPSKISTNVLRMNMEGLWFQEWHYDISGEREGVYCAALHRGDAYRGERIHSVMAYFPL